MVGESKSAFQIIQESIELQGGLAYLTEKIPNQFDQGNPDLPAGKTINKIEDKIFTGPIAAIAAGATKELIKETVQPNHTLIFVGLAGKTLDGLDLKIKDGDGNTIYDNLPGELVGSNIYEWIFKCPHVNVAGKTYIVEATNRTEAAITPILTARAIRLAY